MNNWSTLLLLILENEALMHTQSWHTQCEPNSPQKFQGSVARAGCFKVVQHFPKPLPPSCLTGLVASKWRLHFAKRLYRDPGWEVWLLQKRRQQRLYHNPGWQVWVASKRRQHFPTTTSSQCWLMGWQVLVISTCFSLEPAPRAGISKQQL